MVLPKALRRRVKEYRFNQKSSTSIYYKGCWIFSKLHVWAFVFIELPLKTLRQMATARSTVPLFFFVFFFQSKFDIMEKGKGISCWATFRISRILLLIQIFLFLSGKKKSNRRGKKVFQIVHSRKRNKMW